MSQENDYKSNINGTPVPLDDCGISQEKWDAFWSVFCECEEPDERPYFKPDGVNLLGCTKHGWVCRKCNKFVQIG